MTTAIIYDWYIFSNIIIGDSCFRKTEESRPISTSRIQQVQEVAENIFEITTQSGSTYFLMNVKKDYPADIFTLREVSQNDLTVDYETFWGKAFDNRRKMENEKVKDWVDYRPINVD